MNDSSDSKTRTKSSTMQSLLEEFSGIYAQKLNRISSGYSEDDNDILKRKLSIMESWVQDVTEQNEVLVETVTELEREASQRVNLLQEKIDKMGVIAKESCVSLKDHYLQVNSIIDRQSSVENDAEILREKILTIEHDNVVLRRENAELLNDLDNLGAFIARGQMAEKLGTTQRGLNESTVNLSKCDLADSKSLGENDDETSLETLIQQKDKSDLLILQLQNEISTLKKIQMEYDKEILERDKHIADLQVQLTDFHHQLTVRQTEANYLYLGNKREDPNELQLSKNIDIMARRMLNFDGDYSDLEQYCFKLKTENAECSETIQSLNKRLSEAEKNVSTNTSSGRDVTSLVTKLENEVSEKSVLIKELQGHLASTRHELALKDELIEKVEIKLQKCRLNLENREQRISYLENQLTQFQLELSKFHGQTGKLSLQSSKQIDLILKLEDEVTCLTRQLNNKSSNIEAKGSQNNKMAVPEVSRYSNESAVSEHAKILPHSHTSCSYPVTDTQSLENHNTLTDFTGTNGQRGQIHHV